MDLVRTVKGRTVAERGAGACLALGLVVLTLAAGWTATYLVLDNEHVTPARPTGETTYAYLPRPDEPVMVVSHRDPSAATVGLTMAESRRWNRVRTYHWRTDCPLLARQRRSAILKVAPMALRDAQAEGDTPCALCANRDDLTHQY